MCNLTRCLSDRARMHRECLWSHFLWSHVNLVTCQYSGFSGNRHIVFRLHRCWWSGRSASPGGRCSLQGCANVARWHASPRCLLCFPPDCKYSVNKHWQTVFCAAALVTRAPQQIDVGVWVSDRLATGCYLRPARCLCHWYSVRPGCF